MPITLAFAMNAKCGVSADMSRSFQAIIATILAAPILIGMVSGNSEEDEPMWNCSIMGNADCPFTAEYSFGFVNLTD